MSWQKGQLSFGLLSVLLLLAKADNSVHITSKYGQLVTSSTLNWLPRLHYEAIKEIVIGGYEIGAGIEVSEDNYAEISKFGKPLYVCRALHNGIWLAGSQKDTERRCTVSIHGNVRSYDKYDLLENMDNAGRLSWQHWDKYVELPVGAVTTDTMYVARHEAADEEHSNHVPRYTYYIGTITSNDNFGTISYVTDNGTEVNAKSGDILVEIEPIYYKMNVRMSWDKKRVTKRTPLILGTATLKNEGTEGAIVAEAFAYCHTYSMYWGQGHAMLKGLNTSITLFNGTTLSNIVWGTKEEKNRTEIKTVEIYLLPGTAVNVNLKGKHLDRDAPYVAELIAHYQDGEKKSRMIAGILQEQLLVDIKPEFGPMYYLHNNTLVSTTTTTAIPTTTDMSTTEMTLTTTTTKQSLYDEEKETQKSKVDHQQEIDENRIVPPLSSDTSTMLRDDDSPLSLKNKIESTNSGVLGRRFWSIESMILPFMAIILQRIAA